MVGLRQVLLGVVIGLSLLSLSNAEDQGIYMVVAPSASTAPAQCPSLNFIQEAPQAYYKVYGEWPETFQAIIDAGLIRANLTLDGEHVITPDDGVFSDAYDRLYIYNGPQTPPQLAIQGEVHLSEAARNDPETAATAIPLTDGSTALKLPELREQDVYAWKSARVLETDDRPEENAEARRYGNDQAAHKLMAIAYMCMLGAVDYRTVYGEYPANWNDFVDTGFCPVTSGMLNPATGQPFSSDGSAFSFEFRHLPNGSFTVSVHGDNGDYVKAW